MEKFSESMRSRRPVSEAFEDLWNQEEIARIDIDALEKVKAKNYPYSVEGLAQCMKDNGLDFSSKNDAHYAGLIVSLLKRKVIRSWGGAYNKTVSDAEVSAVEPSLLEASYEFSKSVIIAALHALVKGVEGRIKWYNSFAKAKGDIFSITEDRLINLCKLIHAGSVQTAMNIITFDDVISEKSVYEDRLLIWLSSPSLIRTALKEVQSYPSILGYFSQTAIERYMKFDKAGILAQIASSRLGVYCKGTVDPLQVNDIPKDLKLSYLQQIEAPYDWLTIRRAKIILDAIGYKYGRWYQAEKATKATLLEDVFRAVVNNALKDKSKLPHSE